MKHIITYDKEFIHTEVDVLMFASDPTVGRLYETHLNHINYQKRWSQEEYDEYLQLADKMEQKCWTKNQEYTPIGYKQQASEHWIEWPMSNDHNSRSMGADRVAHEVRQMGYTVQVIHYPLHASEDLIHKVFKKFVGPNTKAVMFGQVFAFGTEQRGLVNSVYFPPARQHKLKEWATEINPNIKFVIGGIQFNATEELKGRGQVDSPLLDIDVFMFGYADVTIRHMMKDLDNNTLKKVYTDAKSLLDIENSTQHYFPEDIVTPKQQLSLEIGRGCIFKCTFCEFNLIGKEKGSYMRSSSRVEDELKRNWEEFGVSNYWITDDTVNDDSEKLEKLAEIKSRTGIPLKWSGFARLDLQHRLKQSQLLVDAGAGWLHYGMETTIHESGILLGKGWDPEEQFEFVRELKAGIFKDVGMSSNFMFGLPEDSYEGLKDSYNKLTDLEYNKLDAIYPVIYKLRRSVGKGEKLDGTKTESVIQADPAGYGYTEYSPDQIKQIRSSGSGLFGPGQEDMFFYTNKHGVTIMKAYHYASTTKKTFNRLKTHAHRNPITASNLLRQEMYNDHTEYFDKVMNIKEHNRVESVTLWKDDVPTTLTVQEYRDSI